MNFTVPGDISCCVFTGYTRDTQDFLFEAATYFAEEYMVLPEFMVMHLWRRTTTLPASSWHCFKHGPIAITLYSPHDAPASFIDVPEHMVICGRKGLL